ncbi:uncharacterized protein LOC118732929 [Rhagoletis pomonella]|uniref:uncharacterized protein LOC118732929 n=1 Tax=Rhagoletis pomonella TaxID=28610 RepID=UPI00177DC307|nr:uncharacterized protein LOC118732929 [Rhagoletis pomonella]
MDNSEYEIQHFNFSVEQFSLERRHYLNKILSLTLQSMLDKLSMNNSETKDLLLKQKDIVKSKMLDAMEKHLLHIEEMDRKNFSIPEYVLLASDYGHTKQYNESDEQEIDKRIAEMKQQFLENSIMVESLKVENEKYVEISNEVENEERFMAQVQTVLQRMESQWKKAQHLVTETNNLE